MLGIYKYLEYKLPEIEEKCRITKENENSSCAEIAEMEARKRWFQKNIRFFKQKLYHVDVETTFITPKFGFFFQHFEKIKYGNADKVVGRLYNNQSIQTLPRELRYHLFKSEYKEFDMVNSHPSILYEFSKQHNLNLNGSLKHLIIINFKFYLKTFKK